MSENKNSLVQAFNSDAFNIRVVMRDDAPWFVAKDVAACIEHSNVSKMCDLCRDKDKIVVRPSDLTSNDLLDVKNREYTLISESGLYRILAKCSLPKCEPFEIWVFDEVLPSIRKTGSYSIQKQDSYLIDDFEERALRWIEEQKEKRRIEAEKQQALANLENEKHGHFHDRMRDNGRCGGYVKNRNHYRTRTTNLVTENAILRDENTELKDENQVLGRLAEMNPTKTIAQWLRAKKRAFTPFLIPSDSEGRILFYRAYERYAKWLNDVYVSRPWAKIGYVFQFDTRKQAYVMSWSLVCRINTGEIADVPEAYDLLEYLR